ncbi:MAG: MFS transporter [Sedimentisphaerales bacterium]|nr:MFS transporter [Sedimentisphaerales bacterium]
MSISLNMLWTAMPFIIRNMGGTEEHVGYTWAFHMLGYMLCLLFAAFVLGHLTPRHATRSAAGAMLVSAIVMVIVVYYTIHRDRIGRLDFVWIMIATGTLLGAAMSLFWPYLMSWVSADYEGPVLNRRLGTYNGMWSSAVILGPLLGGVLVDFNTLGPVVACVISLTICFVLLFLAHDGSAGNTSSVKSVYVSEVSFDPGLLMQLKWMARISLFSSWACIGVVRSQFALLFTDLGFSETQYGMIMTIFGICNFILLTGAGRLVFWHFKPVLLISVQVILALSLILIISGRTLLIFIPALMIMAVGFGFAYSSHLYYGACGSKKRSTQMAIHEAALSLGVIVGAGAGGYLSGNFGIYWPYWFSMIILALGFIAQTIIWVILKPHPQSNSV